MANNNNQSNNKANSKAYSAKVLPVGPGVSEQVQTTTSNNTIGASYVHQVSPAYVLTFVRWSIRDTLRTTPIGNANYSTTRVPLVVENDCIQVSVSISKSVLTDSMNATLVMTDVNYETAVAPGDFVFVNMLNWEEDSRRVADQARARSPINGPNDGFKGVFKVQSVRKNLITDPESGTKIYVCKITGFSFTEFNNSIYFNQELIDQSERDNLLLFASNIRSNWALLQNEKGLTNVQDIMQMLIESFLGTGIGDSGKTDKNGIVKSANSLFYMPQLVGSLLGIKQAKYAKDIYNFFMGIQRYSSNSNQALSVGMTPSGFISNDSRFWVPNTSYKCQGDTVTKPEYWNQVKVWSILNQFTNAPLNELYTCFRISPNGRVMPTMVFRQIPFTTEDFKSNNIPITRFMNIPRWKIDPMLVLGMDIGRDEAARINFVQYFGQSSVGPDGWQMSVEVSQGNYLYDVDDVKRNGLRPYVVNTQFDEPTGKYSARAVGWARIVGDALIGGHLKMNGTLDCVGIVNPIAVGDNLEFDGIVYHIESVTHTSMIAGPNGRKTFRTTIGLSSGLSTDSSSKGTAYPEMSYTVAKDLREADFANNQILPGVSESQDTVYRTIDPDIDDSTKTPVDNPFQQPNNGTSINNSGVSNAYKEKDKK